MPTHIDKNKLKSLVRNPRLSSTDRLLIQDASKSISELEAQIKKLESNLSSETKLKSLPQVKSLIEKEKSKEKKMYQTKLAKLDKTLILKDAKISELTNLVNLTRTKPVDNKEFNNFISQSITELQKSFTQATSGAETDILIRDVEIEARVITEMKNNKPVFIIPSRVDMKELGSENFQKLKYSLSIVPKDIE